MKAKREQDGVLLPLLLLLDLIQNGQMGRNKSNKNVQI